MLPPTIITGPDGVNRRPFTQHLAAIHAASARRALSAVGDDAAAAGYRGMAEPVPAGSSVGHGTHLCTSCRFPLEIDPAGPLCPWCLSGHWQKLSGDYDADPYADNS